MHTAAPWRRCPRRRNVTGRFLPAGMTGGEFIKFLPVLAYDGSAMRQVNAAEILDIAMAGTSATLLAKRWESALLVNVDNETLAKLLANEEAMNALMSIEGFRSLNEDIQTIINKSEHVKEARKDKDNLTPKEKKELSDEEKEYKSKRKMIQEKLIKFATRLPVFMYLSDYREYSLVDVITALEPKLFRKVTGLTVKDFELLVSLNVFNESLMNDAVYKFKRYEDASLTYTGIDSHASDTQVGLYSTSISRVEYDAMAGLQQQSMAAPAQDPGDVPDRPYFVNRNAQEDEEEEEEPVFYPAKKKEPPVRAAERPIVPRTPVTPTYRPAFVPPKPQLPADKPEEKPKTDLSHVGPGTAVIHKAFGEGTVVKLDRGRDVNTHIHIRFGKNEKVFGFPGAFYDGFLKVNE